MCLPSQMLIRRALSFTCPHTVPDHAACIPPCGWHRVLPHFPPFLLVLRHQKTQALVLAGSPMQTSAACHLSARTLSGTIHHTMAQIPPQQVLLLCGNPPFTLNGAYRDIELSNHATSSAPPPNYHLQQRPESVHLAPTATANTAEDRHLGTGYGGCVAPCSRLTGRVTAQRPHGGGFGPTGLHLHWR